MQAAQFVMKVEQGAHGWTVAEVGLGKYPVRHCVQKVSLVHLVAAQFMMKNVQSGKHFVRESVTPFH